MAADIGPALVETLSPILLDRSDPTACVRTNPTWCLVHTEAHIVHKNKNIKIVVFARRVVRGHTLLFGVVGWTYDCNI